MCPRWLQIVKCTFFKEHPVIFFFCGIIPRCPKNPNLSFHTQGLQRKLFSETHENDFNYITHIIIIINKIFLFRFVYIPYKHLGRFGSYHHLCYEMFELLRSANLVHKTLQSHNVLILLLYLLNRNNKSKCNIRGSKRPASWT